MSRASGPILFDLTTSFHFTGNPTGIARVEQRAFAAIRDRLPDQVRPIAWNSKTGAYLDLDNSARFAGRDRDDLTSLEQSGHASLISPKEISSNATLILFGGAWIRNGRFVDAISDLKAKTGIRIALLVHDLIQAKLSYLYPPGTSEVFTQNAQRMFELADLLLCYSQASRADISVFSKECGRPETPIAMFPIGDMTDAIKVMRNAAEPPIAKKFRNRRFVLFVSSIDIRKNHSLLVNVWRRLAESSAFDLPELVLVGRPSWKGDEIVDAIEADLSLKDHVHIFRHASDGDLDWLYRNCLFTVYPSLYEGWGLPVAESLSYGKLCITSDRTATAEVAPDLTELCDPYDFRQWLEMVQFYCDNAVALAAREEKIVNEYKAVPWSVAVKAVLTALGATDYRAPLPDVAPPFANTPPAVSTALSDPQDFFDIMA